MSKRIILLLVGVALIASFATSAVLYLKHQPSVPVSDAPATTPPTTTTLPVASASPTVTLTPFLGEWDRFGASITVSPDGNFEVRYKTFHACSSSPPPCDQSEADNSWGGSASGHITEGSGDTAKAVVTIANDPQHRGALPGTLTLLPNKVLELKFDVFGGPFCNQDSPSGYCGGM